MSVTKIIKKLSKKIPKFLRSKRTLVLAVILIIALSFVLSRGGAKKDAIKTVPVTRQTIVSEVSASGKIGSLNSSILHFAVSGQVVWVGVKEDDYVRRGQAIAALDRERFEIAIRQAEQDVVAADAELAKVYDDISKASGAESFDNRIKRTAAEAKKNKAFDNLKKAERDLKDSTLISPVAGAVVSLNVKPLDNIFTTADVAKVADTGNIEFVAEVDETDVGQIKPDQPAKITLDAFPDQEIFSTVFSIGNESIITSTGATAFEIKLSMPDPQVYRIGMNGEVNIELSKSENALVVPVEAVFDEKFVYVKRQNKFEKREIEVGLSSDFAQEIKLGLGENDQVVTDGFNEINKKSLFDRIFKRG